MLTGAIYQNFVKFFKLTADEISEAQPGTQCTHADIQFPVFNAVISTNVTQDSLPETVKAITHFYQQKKVPFIWWVTDYAEPNNLHQLLEEQGFKGQGSFEGMSYDLSKLPDIPNTLKDIKVENIQSAEELKAMAEIFTTCFEFTPEATEHYIKVFTRLFNDPNLKHYKIVKDDKPVASGTLFLDGEVGGFYNLGVLPAYRHQDLAQAMQWHRLHEAKRLGATIAVLHASAMAQELDEKVGFVSNMKFRPYSK